MTNTTDINTAMNESAASSLLDQLFATGRTDASKDLRLDDDNFTKLVINRLPAKPSRVRAKKYYPDLIGLILGLVATFLVIDPSQIINKILLYIPNTISISLSSMMMASFAFSCLACVAWWSVERSSSRW